MDLMLEGPILGRFTSEAEGATPKMIALDMLHMLGNALVAALQMPGHLPARPHLSRSARKYLFQT